MDLLIKRELRPQCPLYKKRPAKDFLDQAAIVVESLLDHLPLLRRFRGLFDSIEFPHEQLRCHREAEDVLKSALFRHLAPDLLREDRARIDLVERLRVADNELIARPLDGTLVIGADRGRQPEPVRTGHRRGEQNESGEIQFF